MLPVTLCSHSQRVRLQVIRHAILSTAHGQSVWRQWSSTLLAQTTERTELVFVCFENFRYLPLCMRGAANLISSYSISNRLLISRTCVFVFVFFFCRDFGILQGLGLLGTLSKTWHVVTFLYTGTSSWKSLSFHCYSRSLFRATPRNRWRTFQFRDSTNFVGFELQIRKLWTHNGRKPRRPHFSHSAEGIISLSESGIKISPPPIYEGLLSIWHHDLLSLYLAS